MNSHQTEHSVEISQFFYHSDLREINFWDSRSAYSAILTNLEALNFDFNESVHFFQAGNYKIHKPENGKKGNFCTFWRLEFTKLTKFRVHKMAHLELLESQKLISRKLWVIEKS